MNEFSNWQSDGCSDSGGLGSCQKEVDLVVKDYIDFWAFVERSNKAQTLDELFECLDVYSAQLGLDRVIFSLMTDHPSIGQRAGHGVVRSYPEDWMSYYFEKGYEDIDPVRKYVTTWYDGPFFWDQLEHVYRLTKAEKQVLEEGKEAGLLDGIAVPLHGLGGEVAGMGFASSTGGVEVDRNKLSLLYAMAHQFNLVYRNIVSRGQDARNRNVHLTRREKEVLSWVATGKSNWEISEILSVSEHTVDFHLRNIFKKLQVASRIAAVVKAIRMNLIIPL